MCIRDRSYADFVKIKHDQVDNPTQATHFVELEEGTFLKNILGEKYKVNSFHHQILKDVAPGFKVVAKSSDGVIESIEKITEDNFVIGVQSVSYTHLDVYKRQIKYRVRKDKGKIQGNKSY